MSTHSTGIGRPAQPAPIARPRLRTVRPAAVLDWILRHTLAVCLSLLFSLPLIWAVSTSLKTNSQVYQLPPVWIPNPIQWSNYPEALTHVPFLHYMWNTILITVPSVFGAVLSNAIVAYGFARLRWRYRNLFFILCLSTMMIPYQVIMVPLFIIFKQLNWINTFLPLIVPQFFGSPYLIFLLRQFFMTIPVELSDAAKVDGASEWVILTRIITPLSVPALAVVALFTFIWAWGDYLGALLYLGREELYTVAIGLSRYQAGGWSQASWAYLMAASVTSIAPILLIFFFAQRTFIEGITMTGLKG